MPAGKSVFPNETRKIARYIIKKLSQIFFVICWEKNSWKQDFMREHTSSWLDPASLYLFKAGMEALEQCEMFSKFITKAPEIRRSVVFSG